MFARKTRECTSMKKHAMGVNWEVKKVLKKVLKNMFSFSFHWFGEFTACLIDFDDVSSPKGKPSKPLNQ